MYVNVLAAFGPLKVAVALHHRFEQEMFCDE